MSIGKHLLGRKPSPPDPRDWKLAPFLLTDYELRIQAINELKKTIRGYVDSRYPGPPASGSHWAKALALLGQIGTPPSPTGDVIWTTLRPTLDQMDTPHCVGFGWAQWSNVAPIEGVYGDDDGHAIYYECKVIEGAPNQEDGAYVRDGAKAMVARKRNTAYAFATTLAGVKAYVREHGPVVVGSDWYNDMFSPEEFGGYLKPTGGYAGGHCYLITGDLPGDGALQILNSWGSEWGIKGRSKIKYTDFAKLLAADGEAVATLELPL